jgi:hypothetical protein
MELIDLTAFFQPLISGLTRILQLDSKSGFEFVMHFADAGKQIFGYL